MAAETLKLEAQCHPRAHGKQEQNGSGGGESRVVPKQPYILFAPAWKISFLRFIQGIWLSLIVSPPPP